MITWSVVPMNKNGMKIFEHVRVSQRITDIKIMVIGGPNYTFVMWEADSTISASMIMAI